MKCHYEVLGISRDAADDEIKKSYRKLALKWHPDKNPDCIEECTRQFHLIQQAYDVLSDLQERAWYDKHREAILKGGLGHGEAYEDKSLNVYQYFNTSCFTCYGDDAKGFYAVYRKVFENLADEDIEFMDEPDSDSHAPGFGDSLSDYDEVVGPFYAHWESYCTAKSFVWVEEYDTRQGPNRQVRRAMEQENKRTRDKARKERNEEVRALAAFVKKRDRRVHAHKKVLEERAAEINQKAEAHKQRQRRDRRKGLENYKETGWSAMSELEKDLAALDAQYAQQFGDEQECDSDEDGIREGKNDDGEAGDADNEEGEEDENFYDELFCVACNRPFKTDKAFANHEKSKKHRENVTLLTVQMQKEEEEAQDEMLGGGVGTKGGADEAAEESPEEDLNTPSEDEIDQSQTSGKSKLSKKQKKKKRKLQQQMENLSISKGSEQDQNVMEQNTVDAEAAKLEYSVGAASAPAASDVPTAPTGPGAANVVGAATPSAQVSVATDGESDLVPQASLDADDDSQVDQATPDGTVSDQVRPGAPARVLVEGATQEQLEHPACNDATDTTGVKRLEKRQPPENQGQPMPCNKCGQIFRSRNKLFEHIKVTGHALRVEPAAVAPPSAEAESKRGKKKKKGKR